jgi:hypothetical protein
VDSLIDRTREDLRDIRLSFLNGPVITLLLQGIGGSQKLLERCLVENWRVRKFAVHVGGPEPMIGTYD